ncbi:MAG: glutathione S-transferase family protein [Rubrivivax sp.]|nr:glutathione S-transferase family protein [Rubrivivax sp.]
MITLCGFTLSNYHNKVKMVLLEKGIPFEEELVPMGRKSDAVYADSPLGKVPFLRTPQGPLCESQVICDWLEAAYPQPALMPADAFAAAKVRELITFIDLHLELVVRDIYAEAFFGGQVSDEVKTATRKRLERSIPAFKRLARFAPYVAGEQFTLADAAAWVSLPLVSLATKTVYGEDLLAAHGIDARSYQKFIAERPSAQRISADRKRDQEAAKAAAAAAAPKSS